jgi:hypothetical protein
MTVWTAQLHQPGRTPSKKANEWMHDITGNAWKQFGKEKYFPDIIDGKRDEDSSYST